MSSQTMKDYEATLREQMKKLLLGCTTDQQDLFRRMYDHKGTHQHPVDAIPFDKMDWAFSQIEATLKKNARAANAVVAPARGEP